MSWFLRAADKADENGLVYLWLKSFAHSPYGRSLGADKDNSDGERAYWDIHAPLTHRLLHEGRTTIACDPVAPHVIWAFASTDSTTGIMHMAVVKRRFAEVKAELLHAVLEKALGEAYIMRPTKYSHYIPDLVDENGSMPFAWTFDPYVIAK